MEATRCPLIDEWIKKVRYVYTMDYYSAIKMNEFESVLVRWMILEPIIQVSQREKNKYHILTHVSLEKGMTNHFSIFASRTP